MPRVKLEAEKAAGKLISAIQKIWGEQGGMPEADESENVMNRVHDLLQAREPSKMKNIIGSQTLNQFLGDIWLKNNPIIKQYAEALENEISKKNT